MKYFNRDYRHQVKSWLFALLLSCFAGIAFSGHAHAHAPEAPNNVDGRTWRTFDASVPPNGASLNYGESFDFSFTSTVSGSGSYGMTAIYWATLDINPDTVAVIENVNHEFREHCLAGGDVGGLTPGKRYNCGQNGYTVYDTRRFDNGEPGNGSNSHTLRFSVTNLFNDSGSDRSFCLRMHVGRYQPLGMFEGTPAQGDDGPKTIPQIINWQFPRQGNPRYDQAVYGVSEQYCYTVKSQLVPQGDIQSAACSTAVISAYDRNPTRGTQWRLSKSVLPGGAFTQINSGTTGSDAYREVAAPGLAADLGSGGTTVRLKLEALDRDTFVWREVDTFDLRKDCATDIKPAMNASATCDRLNVQVGDPNSNGSMRVFGAVYKRNTTNGGITGQAGSFTYDVGTDGAGNGGINALYINDSGSSPDDNTGWIIDVGVHNEEPNGNQGSYHQFYRIYVNGPCYQASCNLDVLEEPGWPQGAVKANQNFSVNGTISLVSATVAAFVERSHDGYIWTPPERGTPVAGLFPYQAPIASPPGNLGGAQLSLSNDHDAWTPPDPDAEEGSTTRGTFNGPETRRLDGIPAAGHPRNTGITTQQLNYYPDYYGKFRIGGPCFTQVRTYLPFSFGLGASSELKPNSEKPESVDYRTHIRNWSAPPAPNTAVTINMTSRFYRQTAAGAQNNVAGPVPGGTYSADTNILGPATYGPPIPGYQAGDRYCAEIYATYTSGWRGPGGPGDLAGTGSPSTSDSCDVVTNRPYFKVHGNGVSVGGDFAASSGGACSGGGTLASWNNNTGTFPNHGGSSELHTLAYGEVVGFASKQTTFNNGRPVNELTFANHNLPASEGFGSTAPTGDGYSPFMGGFYGGGGGGKCLTALEPKEGVTPLSGNQSIEGRTLGAGDNQEIFVNNGDVFINGDIIYSENGWALDTANGTTNIPSFKLIVTDGNIYIGSNVTRLDGLYIAQTKNNPNKGQIYTCGTAYAPMAKTALFSQCQNQLLVRGSFVAKKVNLMRTLGSLRNETPRPGGPGAGASQPLVWSCNGGICNPDLTNMTCEPINGGVAPAQLTWGDNRLCAQGLDAASIKLDWIRSQGDTPPNLSVTPHCTVDWGSIINAAPFFYTYTWAGARLCSNVPISFKASNTSSATEYCTQIVEPSDPYAILRPVWQPLPRGAVYVCVQRAVPPPPQPADTSSCSNQAARPSSRPTCAAEVFDFSPEFYLSKNPNVREEDGGAKHYDAITSLPPVL